MSKIPNESRTEKKNFPRVLLVMSASMSAVVLVAIVLVALASKHGPLPVVRAATATSVKGKLEKAEHSPAVKSRTVRLSEEEVNALLRDRVQKYLGRVRADSMALRDLRLRLTDDRVKAYVVLGYQASEITIDMEGKLYSRSGLVRFEPLAGGVGMLRIPQSTLVEAVQQALNDPAERQELTLPTNISDLRIENSQVVLQYR